MSDTQKNNTKSTSDKNTKETKTKAEASAEAKETKPVAPVETKAEVKTEVKTETKTEAEAPAQNTESQATKAPMDPKRKKNIILWCSIGGGVAVILIIIAILVPILTRVDYNETYNIASQLNSVMSDFYYDYDDCVDVVDDVNETWLSDSTYSSYVSDCKDALKPTTLDLVKRLSDASGVQRDNDVQFMFNKFLTEFNKAIVSVDNNLEDKLDIYNSWHKFIYNAVDMSFYSNDADDIETYANYAINSGNDTLKAFGVTWKEKALEVAAAYKTYDDATTDYTSLYTVFTTKRDEFEDWVDDNLPDITTIIPLSFEDNAWEIDDAWEDVNNLIYNKFLTNGGSSLIYNTTTTDTTDYEQLLQELFK